jgi:ketosteroid isomerase-like protein
MNDKDLRAYSDAWNAHDIEQIMACHTADCIFETGGGLEKHGTRYSGFAEVRNRFVEVWTDLPDVRFENGSHFVDGDRGCSEWTFLGTRSDGTEIEVNGCDLFTFRDGKIFVKNSLLKNRT